MAKKTAAGRGRLTSMRNQDATRDFVLDQLSGLRGVRAQAMFGGIGLYADDVFFGILAANVLYFKVDDSTRPPYESVGSKPFKPYADRQMVMPYYAVPADVLESAPTLVEWATRAVGVARAGKTRSATRGRSAKPAPAAKTAPKRPAKSAAKATKPRRSSRGR